MVVVVVGIGTSQAEVGGEAAVAHFAGIRPPDPAEPEHGFHESLEELVLATGVGVDEPAGAAVPVERLVGGEHPPPVLELDEVAVVEVEGRTVEGVLLVPVAVAVTGEPPLEAILLDGFLVEPVLEGGAARHAHGVRAGERDEVEAIKGPGAEVAEELRACETPALGRGSPPTAHPGAGQFQGNPWAAGLSRRRGWWRARGCRRTTRRGRSGSAPCRGFSRRGPAPLAAGPC